MPDVTDDRALLEAAAKAVGISLAFDPLAPVSGHSPIDARGRYWNPLREDGQALRLAVELRMAVMVEPGGTDVQNEDASYHSEHGDDRFAATRRAIVRAAAAHPPRDAATTMTTATSTSRKP